MTWNPMETAPRDGTRVLVAFDKYGVELVLWEAVCNIWIGSDGDTFPAAMALGWLPLPPMPEGKVQPKEGLNVARFSLIEHLEHQREWSLKTFGPGSRTMGVIDHIRKELAEIEADPQDIREWVDVIILAFDGAWRAGWEPADIIAAIQAKQAKNEARAWPDWRDCSPDRAIEHVRDCTRPATHDGPCNGLPRAECGGQKA